MKLHFYQYKVLLIQKLLQKDKLRRLKYGNAVAKTIDDEPDSW